MSDSVIIAVIGFASAGIGGIFTSFGAFWKQKSETMKSEAEYSRSMMDAANEQFKRLREEQQSQIDELRSRADSQWNEIIKLREEKHLYELVRITLLEILLAYPNPPGPPKISSIVAQAIGWEADNQ